MTEGHSPQMRTGSAVDPDHDTTALPPVAPSVPPIPPVSAQPPGSGAGPVETTSYGPGSGYLSGSAFSTPSYSGDHTPTSHSGSAAPPDADTTGTIGAVGAKIAAAGAAAVSAATQAASSAKDAIKSAASESEARARPVRGASRAGRQPRKARLTLSHINVYSVFKF